MLNILIIMMTIMITMMIRMSMMVTIRFRIINRGAVCRCDCDQYDDLYHDDYEDHNSFYYLQGSSLQVIAF